MLTRRQKPSSRFSSNPHAPCPSFGSRGASAHSWPALLFVISRSTKERSDLAPTGGATENLGSSVHSRPPPGPTGPPSHQRQGRPGAQRRPAGSRPAFKSSTSSPWARAPWSPMPTADLRLPSCPPGAPACWSEAPGHVATQVDLEIPHRGEWTSFVVRLESLRDRALSPFRRLTMRVLPSARAWGIWTNREAREWLAQRAPAQQAMLGKLTSEVERACYAREIPSEADVAQIEALVPAHRGEYFGGQQSGIRRRNAYGALTPAGVPFLYAGSSSFARALGLRASTPWVFARARPRALRRDAEGDMGSELIIALVVVAVVVAIILVARSKTPKLPAAKPPEALPPRPLRRQVRLARQPFPPPRPSPAPPRQPNADISVDEPVRGTVENRAAGPDLPSPPPRFREPEPRRPSAEDLASLKKGLASTRGGFIARLSRALRRQARDRSAAASSRSKRC